MKQILSIFRIRREERWLAIVTVLVFLLLNAMVVCRYYNDFTRICQNYWPMFVNKYHVSGFDPITYCVLSNWTGIKSIMFSDIPSWPFSCTSPISSTKG